VNLHLGFQNQRIILEYRVPGRGIGHDLRFKDHDLQDADQDLLGINHTHALDQAGLDHGRKEVDQVTIVDLEAQGVGPNLDLVDVAPTAYLGVKEYLVRKSRLKSKRRSLFQS